MCIKYACDTYKTRPDYIVLKNTHTENYISWSFYGKMLYWPNLESSIHTVHNKHMFSLIFFPVK